MNWALRWSLVIFSIAAVGIGLWSFKPTADHSKLPLTYSDGQLGTLEDFHGQALVVKLWSVSCSICLQEAPSWAALQPQLEQQGHGLIGLNIPQDPPPAIMQMLQQLKPPYPNVLDVHGELSIALRTRDITPAILIFDRTGKLREHWVGELDTPRLLARLAQL